MAVLATVIVGVWAYKTSRQALTNTIVLAYFDAVGQRKNLQFPPNAADQFDQWRRFIYRLEYIAELINSGAIEDALVPNSIKCERITARMAGEGNDVLSKTTSTKAIRLLTEREKTSCEINWNPGVR